eukprot:9017836-Pyramimonas_sp.AAC.1
MRLKSFRALAVLSGTLVLVGVLGTSLLKAICIGICPRISRRECVVDFGFNIGQDSAAYIEAGYDVIAVEANPRLVENALRTRVFSRAVREGRLKLLNAAVVSREAAITKSSISFYVGGHAERNRINVCTYPPCEEVKVATVHCAEVLKTCAATYVKIDIEGAENDCLNS